MAERGSSRVQLSLVDRCSRPDASCRNSSTDIAKETQTDQINLPKDERKMIKLLVQYLYEGEYDPVLPPTVAQTTTPAVIRSAAFGNKIFPSTSFPHTCYFRGFDGYSCKHQGLFSHHKCDRDCKFKCKEFTCEACVIPSLIEPSSQLLTHAKMYELADKYEVDGLKDLAKEKFSICCKHFWDTPDFHLAASHAFSTTPENDTGLRDCVSQTIATNMQLLRKSQVRLLLMRSNGLALGILDAKSKELGWV